MGIFDQMKMAQDMMKNMSPEQMKDLMKQAGDAKDMLKKQVKEILDAEFGERFEAEAKRRGLL